MAEENKPENSTEQTSRGVENYLARIFYCVYIRLEKLVNKFHAFFLALAVFGLIWITAFSGMERPEKIIVISVLILITILHGTERYELGKYDTEEIRNLLLKQIETEYEFTKSYYSYRAKKFEEIDSLPIFQGFRVLPAFFMAYLTGLVFVNLNFYYAVFASISSWFLYVYLFYQITVWRKKGKYGPMPNLRRDFHIEMHVDPNMITIKHILLVVVTAIVSIGLFVLWICLL